MNRRSFTSVSIFSATASRWSSETQVSTNAQLALQQEGLIQQRARRRLYMQEPESMSLFGRGLPRA